MTGFENTFGRLQARATDSRFLILLAALAILMISVPVVHRFPEGIQTVLAEGVVNTTLIIVVISAVLAASKRRRQAIIAGVLVVPLVAAGLVDIFVDHAYLIVAKDALGVVFLGYTIYVILRWLFSAQDVTVNTIAASLCAYVMLGLLWAMLYSLLEICSPGLSFTSSYAADGEFGSMRFAGVDAHMPLYFSFVTMTTLGYGDIIPVSASSRTLAAAEAVLGQIYLTVLVARLVGMHISQSSSNKR